ncbi:MAG: calcium/sodium antiporter [Planctomycetota bacterium]
MLTSILLAAVGFVVLYYGAEWLVTGATSMALNLNVSKVVVGLTLVAFGTSSPELFVNLIAAYKGHTGLALANVAGSNLTNLCLGFGCCALVGIVRIPKQRYMTDLIYFWVSPCLVLFFFTVYPGNRLPLYATATFLGLILLYFVSIKKRLRSKEVNDRPRFRLPLSVLIFLCGCGTLYLGGELILYSAIAITRFLGVSEAIIGLTIVAVGTSVPDVMASIIAIKKGESSIAVGNLLGSNIFNILLVLGGTLVASWEDLPADRLCIIDYATVCAVSFLFFVLVLRFSKVSRISGYALILLYTAYMIIRIILGL